MLAIPLELVQRYEARLVQQNVMAGQRPHYHKWLRYYLDFCHKYGFAPADCQSLPAFQEKLRTKHQPETLCQQAGHAVSLYWGVTSPSAVRPHAPQDTAASQGGETRNVFPTGVERAPSHFPAEKILVEPSEPPSPPTTLVLQRAEKATLPPRPLAPSQPPARQETQAVGRVPNTPANSVRTLSLKDKTDLAEFKLTGASWVWVYDGLTSAIKVRHYSPKTLDAYKIWTQKFQTFTQSKNPRLLSMDDVKGFLSFLAVHKNISASSQNQAFIVEPLNFHNF